MGHWRLKIVFCLIFYCGGFLTAIYVLAPSTASAQTVAGTQTASLANVDTEAWAGKLRAGIEKAKCFAEDNALRAAEVIRSKIQQSETK
jgi:hypothetical protein